MKTYTREELLELAPVYAVGGATAEEAAAVESAMPTFPELAAEVASFREVTVGIAEQQQVTPSPAVRAEFLRRMGQTKSAAIPVPPPARPQMSSGSSSPVPAGMWIAMAASVVLAIGFAYQNSRLKNEALERDTALAAATAQVKQSEAGAQRLQSELNSILTAEKSLRIVHMKGADTVSGPGMQFFWNLKQGVGIAHAFRLKPAAPGRAYQIWLLVGGKPVSVKVFNTDADGHAVVDGLTLPASADGVSDVLITEEPAGGSPGPTSTPFVGGKMPAF